ncbi:hypothetical protein LV82_02157 [Albidovulum inexpectatum]|uniref:Uncharacterized protein n=1 Tax=Albidovulum inexpectatum TaxID=196587 RepID=A0A2S5JFL3_9RHOB|nr:hypothetical protein [Albidovulum inexpectatum]PPB80282.1 hypothetical protein LV82_02157 [Albidovulum inexpectatum]
MTRKTTTVAAMLMAALAAFATAMPANAFVGGFDLPRLDFPHGDTTSRACNGSATPVCTAPRN